MFQNLSQRFSSILERVGSKGYLTEEDVNATMREIRISLLEADVSISVVKTFVQSVKEKLVGQKVESSAKPSIMISKIVYDELVSILGGDSSQGIGQESDARVKINDFNFKDVKHGEVYTLMLVGLQGVGKTTTAAKLALYLRKKHKKKPLLVSVDVYRPAAQLQLQTLAKQIDISMLDIIPDEKPVEIVKRAMKEVRKGDVIYDAVIVDTAGRLHRDELLMAELCEISNVINPSDTFMVSDAMVGQESAHIAKEFSDQLQSSNPLTGIVLTRFEGDARGGAALSMKFTTNCPIKFVGVGESLDALEGFYPERAASMILGMGDITSLIEKTSENVSEKDVEKFAHKVKRGDFDLNDLLKQLKSIKKMGSISSIMAMIPGMSAIKNKLNSVATGNFSEDLVKRYEAIICSMNKIERSDPVRVLDASRRRRIAQGSGTSVQDINRLVKQFVNMKNMMKKMMRGGDESAMRGLLSNPQVKNFGKHYGNRRY